MTGEVTDREPAFVACILQRLVARQVVPSFRRASENRIFERLGEDDLTHKEIAKVNVVNALVICTGKAVHDGIEQDFLVNAHEKAFYIKAKHPAIFPEIVARRTQETASAIDGK